MATRFAESFPGEAPRLAAAPGRVNLIGEHTDYNDGFVLPMAIARSAVVAFRPRADGVLRAHSIAYRRDEAGRDRLARGSRRPGLVLVRGGRRLGVRVGGAAGLRHGRRRGRRRADRRGPLVLGRARDGDRARARGRHGHAVGTGADGEARPARGERLRRHELRDHGPVRLGGLRGGQRAAPRLPLARDAGGAGAARRRGGGDGHGCPPLARGERLQRAPRGLRAGGGRDRARRGPGRRRCATSARRISRRRNRGSTRPTRSARAT